VVVGPEVAAVARLVDALMQAGIPAYGPKSDGARLESLEDLHENNCC